ncbi:complement C3-like, partial [Centruroides vittatus]|uniref:complement C3-like n=1 Tax=Centruroides vittatus TaxID=120091 RepID=UPI0035101B11
MVPIWKLSLFLCYLTVINARKIFIATPNTLHLDTDEKIAIVAQGVGNNEELEVYLQDYPSKINVISSSKVTVTNGRPVFVNIRFTANDLPNLDLIHAKNKAFVILIVKGNNFNEEFKLPVDYNAGFVFLQTDKPIYNPQQDVQIRVIPLNEKLLPKNTDVRIKIKNPQNVSVYENTYSEPWKIHSVHFPTINFKFPPYSLLGEWAVEAFYGYNFQQNTSITFQLEEYVLPTFTVELETPNVILPQHKTVDIAVKAEYVYGKKVDGSAIFKISIKNEMGIIEIGLTKTKEVDQGESKLSFNLDEIIKHPQINKFPQGSKLIVEVSVVDAATGNKEIARDDYCEFSKSPYLISFKNSLKDFKPGLISVITASTYFADITYVNGRPAANVPTYISVIDSNNNLIEVAKPKYTSDENGHALFHINTPIGPDFFTVTVTTNDTRYNPDQQFSAKHVLVKSVSKGYIAISRTEGTRKVKVGDKFSATIFTVPPEKFENLFFLVMAQGKIVHISTIPKGQLLQRQLEFPVTADMSPVLRVVVFSLHENELVIDSLRVLVENQCSRFSEVEIKTDFRTTEPGHNGKFILEGEPDTKVGILAVDNAVYALRNKDKLTKEKLFKTLASRDLGCGPGGGRNSEVILSNAGLVIFGNFVTENKDRTAFRCEERIRRKREAVQDMVDSHDDDDQKKCCFLGTRSDKHKRSCEERAKLLKIHVKENEENNTCIETFLKCCLKLAPQLLSATDEYNKELHPSDLSRATGGIPDGLDFVEEADEADFERTLVRRDFRETWLFKDYIIGPDRTTEVTTSLPHSITTWVIQAISLSDQWGMCISEPKEIVSFKNVFIHLNIPYSVVRNEQVEIQATIFNYNSQTIPVTVYMYGVENLCTGVQAGEKSERKKIWVEGNSAGNVGFPVVPLKDQKFPIHMVALSPVGSDVIIKELNVVAEGVVKEEDVVIILDPTNQQRRKRRNVETETYKDTIDDSQKLQVTAIKLLPSEKYVPGTESCVVSAIGTEYGPTVETVIHDPETLIRMPVGCGEQNLMYMGPTLYTLRFLKVKGDVTPEREGKIYNFIREGYNRQLTYRKEDGSYGAWIQTPSSTWLTAFTMKIFCQANKFIFVDENVICSGIKWLISHQKDDGAFEDAHPVYHYDMTGGVNGRIPMTAFVFIALQECSSCESEELNVARLKAELFLEISLPTINDPYIMAVVAYALSQSSSELKHEANEKLKQMSIFDEDLNQRHWKENTRSHSIEVAAYALLTQLALNDLSYSLPIVNWLNTQRLVGGSFPSTQDTVIALQALSQYSMQSQNPDLSLICNVTSSNDRDLTKTLEFKNDNALVLQQFEVNKVGGTLFFRTAGNGVGSLAVKLRYNVPVPVEKLCKFEIIVNVSEAREKHKPPQINQEIELDVFEDFDEAANEIGIDKKDLNVKAFKQFEIELEIKGKVVRRRRNANDGDYDYADYEDTGRVGEIAAPDDVERSNSKVMLEVKICTRYLSDKDSEMTIIDAGIFSGFRPVKEDLDELVNDTSNPVDRYEIAGRGIIFYLHHVSHSIPICLKFRIRRDYIVGNVQASVIKVYDYYNNDDSCTKFYSPDSNSPLLRTICEDSVCECAEGGCPLQKPFSEVSELIGASKQRQRLLWMACEDHDYVWLGKINKLRAENGFLYIDFVVSAVLKAGIEPKEDIEGSHRELMMRDACKKSHLFIEQEYLIMGKDGARYENKITKELRYRYLVDKTTKLQRYTPLIKEAEDKNLQKAMI